MPFQIPLIHSRHQVPSVSPTPYASPAPPFPLSRMASAPHFPLPQEPEHRVPPPRPSSLPAFEDEEGFMVEQAAAPKHFPIPTEPPNVAPVPAATPRAATPRTTPRASEVPPSSTATTPRTASRPAIPPANASQLTGSSVSSSALSAKADTPSSSADENSSSTPRITTPRTRTVTPVHSIPPLNLHHLANSQQPENVHITNNVTKTETAVPPAPSPRKHPPSPHNLTQHAIANMPQKSSALKTQDWYVHPTDK